MLIGNDSGVQARVAVYDVTLTSATFQLQFTPYGASTSGVRVAAADLDWDGAEEVIVTPVAGTGAEDVRAFDLSGGAAVQVASYAAFTASYAGNVFVAAGYGHGALPAPTTSYAYDANGRVETETDPLGRVTTYDYDAAGNLTSLTDAAGNVTRWVYDALGRVTSETDPLGEVTSYAYDALGNLTRLTDRLGRVTEYVYDALGRLTTETWRDAAGAAVNTVHYAFDAAGRLDLAWDTYSTYDYGYDALGRLLTVDNAGNGMAVPRTLLTATYDAAGNRTGLSATNPGGTHDFLNTYQYDAAGRMTRVTQQGQTGGRAVAAKRVDLDYDDLGRLDLVSRYADLAGTALVATSDYAFDLAGRMTGLVHAQGGTTFAGYAWSYNALGRLTQETGPDGTESYGYDPTGQLTRAGGPDAAGYGYDATGNRTSDGSQAGAGNRLTEDAEYVYEYDDAGNRTKRTSKADGSYEVYTWDHRNRLKWVAGFTAAGARQWIAEYRYDLYDRVIARYENTDNSVVGWMRIEKFVYDSAPGKGGLSDVVLVFDGNGAVTNRYLHGPGVDQLFADESAVDGILWALADRQGSVRDWAQRDAASGATSVYNHVEFDAWGQIESQSNANHRVTTGHAGRYHDPLTGLVWHLYRWRDPKATWLSPDPKGFAAGDPNLYRFAGSSPTNFEDPDGLQRRPSRWGGGYHNPGSGRGYRPPRPTLRMWPPEQYPQYRPPRPRAFRPPSSGPYPGPGTGGVRTLVPRVPRATGPAPWVPPGASRNWKGTPSRDWCPNPASPTAQQISDLLRLLPKGRSAGVRTVRTPEELRKTFDCFSAGGTPTGSTYPGSHVRLPDGTLIGIRGGSRSGGPTIDITYPDGGTTKIHVYPWP